MPCDDGAVSRPIRRPADGAADLDLLRRIAAGDRSALVDLYDRFRRPAFALARRVLADDVHAERVLQEVFLGVWRDPSAFDRSPGSVASWLLATVHHRAVDAVRREESHRRRRSPAEDALAPGAPTPIGDLADQVVDRVAAERVRTALQALPGAQREALTLACYGGYTQREVAALTGAPLGTVKTRMLIAVRRLEEVLGTGLPGGATRADGATR
jgi:RNA polymerase sigma factor (sigma-70 family)